MATRASTLGVSSAVRPMLVGLWLAAVAIVLATVLAAALMVGRATPTRTEPAKGPAVSDTGPEAPAYQPIKVSGTICAQCR
ncbi:MAG: hypothetical protein ACRDIX_02335 [Actinomycetota bacterium]